MIDYGTFDRAVGLDWYAVDPNLQALVERLVDATDRQWARARLREMGRLAGGQLAEAAEIIDKHPPRLERYDRWGEDVGRIVHHPAALAAKKACWESGFSGSRLALEAAQRGRPLPAVLRTAALYLLCQADTGLSCAVGMTEGLAMLVERFATPEVRERLLPRLTARSFAEAWDGAMFMTERSGGSDLGALTTTARQMEGRWLISGAKWFCSNLDAAAIATLARPGGAPAGLKGVALFVVPRWRSDGSPNGIRIRRLKEKLGTRTVPTGEVDFVDAEAYLLAGPEGGSATDGRGINRMMEMVNTSRLGVACMGLGIMRRAFLESAIYAAHREAWGRRLIDLPLVRETLLRMIVELEATAALVFGAAAAAGGADPALARLLVPLAKLHAARKGIELASAAVEMHGGNGYVEDWPLARLLREAQCHTIWEGTENILCLDVLRALASRQVAEALRERLAGALNGAPGDLLAGSRARVAAAAERAVHSVGALAGLGRAAAEYRSRALARRICAALAGAMLLEEAAWELGQRGSARKAVVAALFATSRLSADEDAALAFAERVAGELFVPLLGYGVVSPAAAAGKLLGG